MKKINKYIVAFLTFWAISFTLSGQNYLSVKENKLIDSRGQEVRLTGVNWFGFETSNLFPHGIWSRDTKSMLQQIKDQGFNCIRLPWCNKILDSDATFEINAYGTDPYTGVSPMNEYESTLESPVELMDVIVEWCQDNNMKLILDNHSRQPDGYMNESLWYTDETSEEQWIEDWVFLAERYKDYDAVIGMDLNNEPHGKYGTGATWGDSDTETDWNKAAERCGNAILAVNPNVLILVEGIESYEEETYWWGGNLKGVRDYPVELDIPEKLLYSAHEYGPTVFEQTWFSASDFPDNMPEIWEENFAFIYEEEISHMLIGEFGIRDSAGVDEIWFDAFMEYMGGRFSWTFWCWNPNSGDTGGLLDDQWTDIVEWKLVKLLPYLADEIPNGEINANTAPVADVTTTDIVGYQPLTVTFDASASYDPDGDEITYLWDFGTDSTSEEATASYTYTEAGEYAVTFTITDAKGLTDVVTLTVVVNPEGVPVAIISASSESGIAPLTVIFDASLSTDPDDATLNYSWNFGDGNSDTGVEVEHTFETAGSYIVVLTADNGTLSGTDTVIINVEPAAAGFCENPDSVSIPLVQSGSGEYCLAVSDDIGYVNSWGMTLVEINGEDYTNVWSSDLPEKVDGYYYIYCKSDVSWSQFEAGTLKGASTLTQLNQNSIKVSPNPFEISANIIIQSPESVNKIEVFNALGKLVYAIDKSQITNYNSIGEEFESGLYIVRISSENKTTTLKTYKY